MKLKAVDLFSGIGGMTQGIINAGFDHIGCIDFDKNANRYNKLINGNITIIDSDIYNIEYDSLPQFDVLFSKLPLQSFSVAGNLKGLEERSLVSNFIRFVEQKAPAVVVIETLDISVSDKVSSMQKKVCDELNKLGYLSKSKSLSLFEYAGLPYCSSKAYTVGFLDRKSYASFKFPDYIELDVKVTDLVDFEGDDRYKYYLVNESDEISKLKTGFYLMRKEELKPIEKVNDNGQLLAPRGVSPIKAYSRVVVKDRIGVRSVTDREMMALLGFNDPDESIKLKAVIRLNSASSPIIIERIGMSIIEAVSIGGVDKMTPQEFVVDKQIDDESNDDLNLMKLLNDVEKVKNTQKKGKALEKLMYALFSAVDGFYVRTNIRTANEEIDIDIRNESKDRFWDKEQHFIIGECKNWSSNVERKEIDIFYNKIVNRNDRAKTGYFISWNGFSKGAKEELLRFSRDKYLIIPVDGIQIRQAILENRVEECLKEWYTNAVHT